MKTVCAPDNVACLVDKVSDNPGYLFVFLVFVALWVYGLVFGNLWRD